MDARFAVSRDELYNLQMEVKQVQYAQTNHAERLLRLEKRNAEDSALKSVWNSPFPSVLGGTPHQGPVQIPHSDVFDDLDEQGEQLLGSLNLGPAEEEPVRRGAASRANSVRFDESALHGSSWTGQNNRHSGEFGPIRPGSSLMMERSLSHKSDGRHSSAGHSVHSHHSVASGRASSIGMDTHYPSGDDDSPPFDMPEPPVSLYVLGTVPSIIRCWLTTNFAHGTLLYADICTGSQKSVLEASLLRELGLLDEVDRGQDGIPRIRLNVYLAEAVVVRHEGQGAGSRGAVPSMAVVFEVTGTDLTNSAGDRKSIRIFIGSDGLRAHSADILFSQNTMVLYGDEQDRLRVPFVRPEDENMFRHIYTTSMQPEKPKLNATATPFVVGDGQSENKASPAMLAEDRPNGGPRLPSDEGADSLKKMESGQTMTTEHMGEHDRSMRDPVESEHQSTQDDSSVPEAARRESGASTGIWGSWRQGAGPGPDGMMRETGNLSGYQPAGRSGRSMKVLKPSKSNNTNPAARAGVSYDLGLSTKHQGDGGRKSLVGLNGDGSSNSSASTANRWDVKRSAIPAGQETKSQNASRENAKGPGLLPRAANPVGVASAFSWMTPPTKPT